MRPAGSKKNQPGSSPGQSRGHVPRDFSGKPLLFESLAPIMAAEDKQREDRAGKGVNAKRLSHHAMRLDRRVATP